MVRLEEPPRNFSYRESRPPKDLSHLAFCFFEFSVGGTGPPIPFEVIPDGFVSLMIRRNLDTQTAPDVLMRGLSLETFHASVSPGDVHWGMKISPAANRLVLKQDPRMILTGPLHSGFLEHFSSNLDSKISEVYTFKQARNLFSSLLQNLQLKSAQVPETVSMAVDNIIASNGMTKMTDVFLELGVNRRSLERKFRDEVGMTMKQYARVFRLRSTAISLIEEDNLDWANRAAEMGFSDQSHLIKEFVALTGRTPKKFSKRIDHTDYGNLVG